MEREEEGGGERESNESGTILRDERNSEFRGERRMGNEWRAGEEESIATSCDVGTNADDLE